MSSPGRTLILGAGPTGLGAAWRLTEAGHRDFLVLEASGQAGGLAASFTDEHGFTWDVGGHVQFSHYAYYDAVLDRALGDAWLQHEREAWVWVKGRFVPYPFQENLHRLDPADAAGALRGLEEAAAAEGGPAPQDLESWIARTFGGWITEHFLAPYNRKVWGYPLGQLGVGWMGERVAVPSLDRVRHGLRTGEDQVAWGPNRRFRFPRSGGTGAIWRAVAALLPSERLRFGAARDGGRPGPRRGAAVGRRVARVRHPGVLDPARPPVRDLLGPRSRDTGRRGGPGEERGPHRRGGPRGHAPRRAAHEVLDVFPRGGLARTTASPCSPTTRPRTRRRAAGR